MSLPPFVARLIGIGKYNEQLHPKPEGDTNAENLGKFLKEEFVDQHLNHDIKTVTEGVTKDKIIETIKELQTIDRSKANLFFFSGFGGRIGPGPSVICPADFGQVDKSKGITDQELLQYFYNLSRYRGYNITFLLDCPSSTFRWGNPSSFVVIAPRTTPLGNRRAFTDSIIEVLRSEKDSLALLTVQSFAAKVHAVVPGGVEIDCYGRNVDRLLFNPSKGRAHHAFIPGRAAINEDPTLFAGFAHGVTEGSIFGIYKDHIAHDQNPEGHLQVKRVQDSTTSTLRLLDADSDFDVPAVFYAVPTHCPDETVDVFNSGDVDFSSPDWKRVEEAKANITLERISDSDRVKVFWNGFADPGIRIKPGPDNCLSPFVHDLVKVIRHAARFKYIVGSLVNSPSSPLFNVKFRKVDKGTDEPTGGNLLEDRLVELKIKEDDGERMYCLVLRNVAKVDIWPVVFRCDPRKFTIEPWYTPEQPLAPKTELIIRGDDEGNLMFPWQSDPSPALTYLKIFATKAPTSFLFLTQNRSSTEDTFREVGKEATVPNNGNSSRDPQSPSTLPLSDRKSDGDDWQTMQITVKKKYKTKSVPSSDNSRRSLKSFLWTDKV